MTYGTLDGAAASTKALCVVTTPHNKATCTYASSSVTGVDLFWTGTLNGIVGAPSTVRVTSIFCICIYTSYAAPPSNNVNAGVIAAAVIVPTIIIATICGRSAVVRYETK